jgi:hypothetical protein
VFGVSGSILLAAGINLALGGDVPAAEARARRAIATRKIAEPRWELLAPFVQ